MGESSSGRTGAMRKVVRHGSIQTELNGAGNLVISKTRTPSDAIVIERADIVDLFHALSLSVLGAIDGRMIALDPAPSGAGRGTP